MLGSGLAAVLIHFTLAGIFYSNRNYCHCQSDETSSESVTTTTDLSTISTTTTTTGFSNTLAFETSELLADSTTNSDIATSALFSPTTSSVATTNGGQDGGQDGGKNYIDMEITSIEVLPRSGNSVILSWGRPIREFDLGWSFGVYYGTNSNDLKKPKLTTKDLYSVVKNLTFCSQYTFAVVGHNNPGEANLATAPRNTRTIGTLIDEFAAPEGLRVDFIPDEEPCLLIKWSASCPNIARPLGYSLTVMEKHPTRLKIITIQRTTSPDLNYPLRVIYGKSYAIKVSTDIPGAEATEMVSTTVPLFLQPHRVRLTSQPDGTFIMYWHEPFVPYYVGRFFYEVFVYPGRGIGHTNYTTYSVNKPIFIFKGDLSEYTFMVGLRSFDGAFKSYLTDPVVKSVYGGEAVLINNKYGANN